MNQPRHYSAAHRLAFAAGNGKGQGIVVAPRMLVTIHQPEHLPWLGFLHKAARADRFVLLDNVDFRKNYFQNRNRIAGRHGPQWLTVPVLHRGDADRRIAAIRINHATPWRRKYIATLEQTYGRHPFAHRYLPAVAAAIEEAGERLVDLNLRLIRQMFEWYGIRRPMVLASSLEVGGSKSDLLLAICRRVAAGIYLSGPSGRDYLSEALFREAGIAVAYASFAHPVYAQRGAGAFVPSLSALDALLNLGDGAAALLERS